MSDNLFGINSNEVDLLISEIERLRRRKIVDRNSEDDVIYVDPNYNISKLKVHNNHLIFGRRGCGKTTLVLATMKENPNDVNVVIDAQVIRKLDHNKIIVSVLNKIIIEISQDFKDNGYDENQRLHEIQYRGFRGFLTWLSMKRDKEVEVEFLKNEEFIGILNQLHQCLNELEDMPDEIEYKIQQKDMSKTETKLSTKDTLSAKSELTFGGDFDVKIASIKSNIKSINNVAVSRQYEKTKAQSHENQTEISSENTKLIRKDALLRELRSAISDVLNLFFSYKSKSVVLYLDDFYQVNIDAQPIILQYFHDIYKNCTSSSFCFKVCSLPHRLRINLPGEVDFSHKDDFSPIRLDNNLSDLEMQKDYLVKILCSIDGGLNITPKDVEGLFNNNEVLLYAVVATGGIPRDFLIMFADLVKKAREDNKRDIQKEHVYSVVKELKADKDDNIEFDSDIDPERIREAIRQLQEEVVDKLQTNVFLYPSAYAKRDDDLLKNLINLRYLHVVKDSTSSENRKKEEFVAFLVDMIFYATTKRMKPGFKFRHFWVRDNRSRLKDLDSAPIWHFNEGSKPENASSDNQSMHPVEAIVDKNK